MPLCDNVEGYSRAGEAADYNIAHAQFTLDTLGWTDHVRNEDVLLRVKEQRNILHEIRKRKANWIGHILRRNCLVQRVIEGKIQGGIEVTGRQGRRRRKLLDDLKERRGYSHLKEQPLDRTMWRARFGRGFGPVVRQTTKWKWESNSWPSDSLYKHATHTKFHKDLSRPSVVIYEGDKSNVLTLWHDDPASLFQSNIFPSGRTAVIAVTILSCTNVGVSVSECECKNVCVCVRARHPISSFEAADQSSRNLGSTACRCGATNIMLLIRPESMTTNMMADAWNCKERPTLTSLNLRYKKYKTMVTGL